MRQTEITKHRFQIDMSIDLIKDVVCNGLDKNQNLQKNRILRELKKINERLDKLTLELNNKLK